MSQVQDNTSLAKLSTFAIGGRAKKVITVGSGEELIRVASRAEKNHVPYRVFAGGSNIVFPDEGIAELLIRISGGSIARENHSLIVDPGVILMETVAKAISLGLSGLETLSGIPGTVGGAVVGNAGAYGHSISEVVDKVAVLDGSVNKWLDSSECQFSYRESIFKHSSLLVTKIVLKFKPGDEDQLRKTSTEIMERRKQKYKPGIKCPGSFFKNVLVKDVSEQTLALIDRSKIIDGKIPAGYLLEQVGAKGMKVGGIEIASYHGNLFINTGKGTADDVKTLAEILKKKVQEKFGVGLEEEIRYF